MGFTTLRSLGAPLVSTVIILGFTLQLPELNYPVLTEA